MSRFFLRAIDNKVRRYIACSYDIKNDLKKIGIDDRKIEVIYNGVDLPEDNRKTFSAILRIGIVGQLIHRKGHLVLLEATKLLKEKYKKRFVIHVVGTGNQKYASELLEYVRRNDLEDHVQFKGHVNNPTEIYSNIDLTVVPSLAEAFGLIAVESYFYKVPVIASRVGGLAEIVVDGLTGYLVQPGNAEELAAKIDLLLDDSDLREKMAAEGFDYCRSHFLKTTMQSNILSSFSNL